MDPGREAQRQRPENYGDQGRRFQSRDRSRSPSRRGSDPQHRQRSPMRRGNGQGRGRGRGQWQDRGRGRGRGRGGFDSGRPRSSGNSGQPPNVPANAVPINGKRKWVPKPTPTPNKKAKTVATSATGRYIWFPPLNGSLRSGSDAPTEAESQTASFVKNGSTAADAVMIDPDEDSETEMRRVMGFNNFRTTQNTKVPGNDKNYAVRKDKKSEYRQYMNRVGGFNRPLSPTRR